MNRDFGMVATGCLAGVGGAIGGSALLNQSPQEGVVSVMFLIVSIVIQIILHREKK